MESGKMPAAGPGYKAFQFSKGCRFKRRFETEKHAKFFIPTAPNSKLGNLYPYKCNFCNGWHLGHIKF